MNYGLLLLSFLLCGIGLTLGFVYWEPFGFVLDSLGFMLFLYVLHTRKDETSDDESTLMRVQAPADEKHATWICPDCKALNLKRDILCRYCGRIKPPPMTEQEQAP